VLALASAGTVCEEGEFVFSRGNFGSVVNVDSAAAGIGLRGEMPDWNQRNGKGQSPSNYFTTSGA